MKRVILICGKICSGKSYYAKQLKKTEKAVILSTDETTYDLINNEQGEFYNTFANRVNMYLRKKAVEIVNAGATVILDWGFWTKESRRDISEFLKSNNIPYEWHYVDVNEDKWKRQIKERNEKIKNGQNSLDFYVDEGLLNKLLSLFEEPSKADMDIWYING
ncbi:MAG: ATP-binding protein [Clostridium sp.]|nr:ATP-binding protein [Clostridium sp.]MCM1546966.1 ATP-binding protein [Ruminococcus sp.]